MDFLTILKGLLSHAALGIAALLSLLGIGALSSAPAAPVATTTPAANVAVHTPLFPLSPTAATTSQTGAKKPAPAPTLPKPGTPTPVLPPTTTSTATHVSVAPPTNETDLNASVRQAVVNILCLSDDPSIHSISGSGVMIDPRGIILTNAHVAQFLLLADYPKPGNDECFVRTGSPARAMYHAELLYISPQWVRDNAHSLIEADPVGTGEDDFAFLRITDPIDANTSLPTAFPALSMDLAMEPAIGEPVLLAGYPAGFLDGLTIATNLYAVSSPSTVQGIYTFTTNTPDLVSLGGTIVAQKGASGGAVVNEATGKLIGLIVTATDAPTTGERDLRAITLPYIARDLADEQHITLSALLSGDIAGSAANFQNEVAPTLTRILTNVLSGR